MTDSRLGVLAQGYEKLVGSPRVRVMAAAIASAVTWFCWAYWANREDPNQALLSGLFQGGVNFITTAFGSALLEALYNRIGDHSQGRAMCVVIVSSGSLVMMLCAHWLASTPNILLTVLPVYTVVILYCSSYIFGLHKIKNKYETEEVAVQ